MVKLSTFKKDIMKYYCVVDHIWTVYDYHCVNVECYDETNVFIWRFIFDDFQQYLDEININDKEYDSIQIKYDPIIIQFPSSSLKNLR